MLTHYEDAEPFESVPSCAWWRSPQQSRRPWRGPHGPLCTEPLRLYKHHVLTGEIRLKNVKAAVLRGNEMNVQSEECMLIHPTSTKLISKPSSIMLVEQSKKYLKLVRQHVPSES